MHRRVHPTHCKDQVNGDPMTPAIVAWVIGWVVLIVVVTLFGNRSKPITCRLAIGRKTAPVYSLKNASANPPMKANDVWEEQYKAAVLQTDSEKLPKLFFH